MFPFVMASHLVNGPSLFTSWGPSSGHPLNTTHEPQGIKLTKEAANNHSCYLCWILENHFPGKTVRIPERWWQRKHIFGSFSPLFGWNDPILTCAYFFGWVGEKTTNGPFCWNSPLNSSRLKWNWAVLAWGPQKILPTCWVVGGVLVGCFG